MDLNKAIKSRRNIKNFKTKAPDWRDIIECIDTCRYAPMAGDIYSLKFILTSDPEKIQKLAECAQQPFIEHAQYVVAVFSAPKKTINAYGERGEIYLRQQAGAAIQNFLLKITEKGLATCWVWHFVEPMVKECLKIPQEAQVEALLPIGYEFKKPTTTKAVVDIDTILYFDEYGLDKYSKKYRNKKMNHIKRFNV